jgi:hypothetical protein
MEEGQQDAHQIPFTYPKHAEGSCTCRWEIDYRQHFCFSRPFRKSLQLRCRYREQRGTSDEGIVIFLGPVGTTPGGSTVAADVIHVRTTNRNIVVRRCGIVVDSVTPVVTRPAKTVRRTRVIMSTASTAIPFLAILTSHRERAEKIGATARNATANGRRGELFETSKWFRCGTPKVDSNRRSWRK